MIMPIWQQFAALNLYLCTIDIVWSGQYIGVVVCLCMCVVVSTHAQQAGVINLIPPNIDKYLMKMSLKTR